MTRRRLTRRAALRGLGAGVVGAGAIACETTPAAPAVPATAASGGASPPTVAAVSPAAATPTAFVEQPKRGGALKTATTAVPRNLEPHAAGGIDTNGSAGPLICYSQLLNFRWGPDITPPVRTVGPDLAESWTQPDELTYLFKLRSGMKWHNVAPVNGRELTAEDVAYSFQRIRDLRSYAGQLAGVTRMEAVDRSTFKITMEKPNADLLANLCNRTQVMVAREAVEAQGGTLENAPVIGTGPWLFDTYTARERFTAKRNPDYFLRGLPYFDTFESYILADVATLISAFRGSTINVIGAGGIPQTGAEIARAVPQAQIRWVSADENQAELGLKLSVEPFSDLRVRQAISKALDRKAIIETVHLGRGSLNGGFAVPDPSWSLPEAELSRLQARDLEGARRLLREAGKEGLSFEILVPPYQQNMFSPVSELVQAQLREAGINATLKPLDSVAFQQAQSQGNYQAYVGLISSPTPNAWLTRRYTTGGTDNHAGYSNPNLDRLIEQQFVMSRDPEGRKRIIQEIQRTIINDAVYQTLHIYQQPIVSYPEIKNLVPPVTLGAHTLTWSTAWLDK
jgi:peptide/nickel transport system substrate-binding protein